MPSVSVNKKSEGDNGYIALYKGRRAEVWAKTSYDAHKPAVAHFGAKRSWDVTVTICETATGAPVVHVATD